MTIEMRKVQYSDFESLGALYSEVYGIHFNPSYWNWKYFQNPNGEHMMYLALDGGRVVGEVGSIAAKIKCGDSSYPASQTCDITVLPEYQKGGTFLKLYKLSNEEHVQRDILTCYGFSVPVTLKISSKLLKFQPVCPVMRWVLILNPIPFLHKKFKMPIVAKAAGSIGRFFINLRIKRLYRIPEEKIIEIHFFDERFDRFWEERKKDYEIMLVRDSTYLNWRYIDHPARRYKVVAYLLDGKIKGFIVFTTGVDEVRRGIIMDIMVDPSEKKAVDYLLSAAIKFFYKEATDAVVLWLPEHASLVRDIKKWGFVRCETQHNLIARIVQQEEKRVNPEYIMNPDNWYFTMGDSDYW